jgi:hypothetical protein
MDPPVDFARGMAQRALSARERARRARAEGDRTMLDEWRATIARYPRLERSLAVRFLRFKHALRRRVRRANG